MSIRRLPSPALRPFIETLWVSDAPTAPRSSPATREHVLPMGSMHVVFRLSDAPLRLFRDNADRVGHTVGHALVGGARATFYVRDISVPTRSVGAQLRPGVAAALLGLPADEVAGRHIALEDLWGRTATLLREQLLEVGSAERQLALFESVFAARLPKVRGMHPAIAQALAQFSSNANIYEAVRASGFSHRAFIAQFRRAVGLTPKLYCRILRFRGALRRMGAHPAAELAEFALAAGYSDQAHFSREFVEFAGVTPSRYRDIAPPFAHHIAVDAPSRS